MAPFYRGFTTNVKLASDDIDAIQELYGDKTKECVPSAANIVASNHFLADFSVLFLTGYIPPNR